MHPLLGQLILALHLVVIAFNVAGLVVIPLGAKLNWPIVRVRLLRLLHLGSMALVAVQAVLGRACFLTIWQSDLTGGGRVDPLIMRWINSVVFWPLPIWAFTAIYLAAFAYVVGLWWLVRPRPKGAPLPGVRRAATCRQGPHNL